jgi:hypothetical protein
LRLRIFTVVVVNDVYEGDLYLTGVKKYREIDKGDNLAC